MVELMRRGSDREPEKPTEKAAEQITNHAKKVIESGPPEDECIWVDPYNLIPTGSTLLNCALSDHYEGGYQIGSVVNTIGDSDTGKTLLALSSLAEMALHKRFDDYRFIFDPSEPTLANNIKWMFGSDVFERIELDRRSDTIQDLYINLLRAIKEGRPFVYILDSLDALTSREERIRGSKMLSAKEKEELKGEKTKEKGNYKMEKAKLLSEILRVITREIKDKEAFVNIISQTRDNVGWGFTDKTRSGGRALKFYSLHEFWVSYVKPLNKLKEKIGSYSKIQVSKNHLTFKKRIVDIQMYDSYGIDDVGSCIDFLVSQKVWKKDKNTIKALHFGWEGVRENIIKRIEYHSKEQELSQLVGRTWGNKEDCLRINRKRRYK